MSLSVAEVPRVSSEASRPDSPGSIARYPLLEALMEAKGLKLKGIYTIRDAAQIFGTSVRTIQEWVRDGKLVARDLPGRGRFLSEDLDRFLQASVRKRDTVGVSAPIPKRARKRLDVVSGKREGHRHV